MTHAPAHSERFIPGRSKDFEVVDSMRAAGILDVYKLPDHETENAGRSPRFNVVQSNAC